MASRNFDDFAYVRLLNTEDTLANGQYPSTYIDVGEYERFVFLIGMGDFDSDITFQVQEADGAAGSLSDISGATVTAEAATDDDLWCSIEVETARMTHTSSSNKTHVTLTVSGVAGANDYASIFFIGYRARREPVTQLTGASANGGQISGGSVVVAG